jgi:putative transposase
MRRTRLVATYDEFRADLIVCRDAKRARRLLDTLAERLDVEHPGAAASLREGLDETLTLLALGLPDRLEQTLRTTNRSTTSSAASVIAPGA